MATARLQIHPSQARHQVFARFALGVAQGPLNRPVNLHCGHGITHVPLQHPIIWYLHWFLDPHEFYYGLFCHRLTVFRFEYHICKQLRCHMSFSQEGVP